MAIIRKNISFVMQLDGITINDMTTLRENPSSELLQMHQDGRLGRWLRAHNAEEERNKLNNLVLTGDQVKDLAAIFEILGIDRDIDDIKSSIFLDTGLLTSSKSSDEILKRLNLVYFIQSLFLIRNNLPDDINFIDQEYISLKISTKKYFENLKINKIPTDKDIINTFFNVEQINIRNLLPSTYIDRIIRCIYGTEKDLKFGEKHIESPSWNIYKETSELFSSQIRIIYSVEKQNYLIINRFFYIYINDIRIPIKMSYNPYAVYFILQKIYELTSNLNIKFK